ncbi:2524_t:CDS:2 [Entrophospora sp. SA101]|nr:2524_t:CDS:2 [Entrophospora sp. SA101]
MLPPCPNPNHIAEPKWNELTKCENGSKCDTGAPFTMTLVKTINRVLVSFPVVATFTSISTSFHLRNVRFSC